MDSRSAHNSDSSQSEDILSDILEITTLDVPHNVKMPRERAVLVQNCWGRNPHSEAMFERLKVFKKPKRRLGFNPAILSASKNFESYNSEIRREFEKFGIQEDKTMVPQFVKNMSRNSECVSRIKPVFSYMKASSETLKNPNISTEREMNGFENDLNKSCVPKLNQCSLNKDSKYEWKFERPVCDSSEDYSDYNCSEEITIVNNKSPTSFKDKAEFLPNSSPTSRNLKTTNRVTKDNETKLNDEAAIEVRGFPPGVTEQSIYSYISSFGTINQIELHRVNNEVISKIWMNNKNDCEWIISCLDGQESPIGDLQNILTVSYISPAR